MYAEAWARGLNRCGESAVITGDPKALADYHIVIGPWFALPFWQTHPRTIWVDRAFYKSDPEHVSIGWATKTGGRKFIFGEGRTPPKRAEKKSGDRTIFLADYNGPIEPAHTIRLHPAQEPAKESLKEALAKHDIAIGYKTTALVAAYLSGLEVIAKDPEHILNQGAELLPYADWGITEIESGEAWQHLTQ